MPNQPLTVMVSSSVYGNQELLERIYTLFDAFGYQVWMSHKGTVSLAVHGSAFDACLQAVEDCDLFFGLITPYYGSGRENRDSLSITHQEFRKAIELDKPRWIMAHSHVVFARSFINNLGLKSSALRPRFRPARTHLMLKKNNVFEDLNIIEIYEEAIQNHLPLAQRTRNWVQEYQTSQDVFRFIESQFSDQTRIRSFLESLNAMTGEES